MTLRTICQTALNRIGSFDIPNAIIGNAAPEARQTLAYANATGQELARKFAWQALLKSYTFTTSDGVAEYDLPSDYLRFANLSFWDRTNEWELLGPATPIQWQTLKSGIIEVTIRRWFRIAQSQFQLHPVPTAADTIAYDYYSKHWCQSDAEVGQTEFLGDTDISLIDEELMTMGVKWRFLEQKGLPYFEARREFEEYRDALLADDTPKPLVNMGGEVYVDNIPEGNYGL
jgi:hypothetical protein